jgi:hypothetical protein
MGPRPSFSCGACEASVLPAIDSNEPYIFNGFCVVFWRLFNQHDNIAANFQKTVSAGARSQLPLLIEWETFAGGFENQSKTYVFCCGVAKSKNICLDFLACHNKKFEKFEVMHLEHPPIYAIICSYVYPYHVFKVCITRQKLLQVHFLAQTVIIS